MQQQKKSILITLFVISISVGSILYLFTAPVPIYRYSTIFIDDDTIRIATTIGPPERKCSQHDIVNNVAFIKTHKTASTTVSRIIERYGFMNSLSFVLNKNIPKNGHFYYTSLNDILEEEYFLPPRGTGQGSRYTDFRYNISSAHVLYNRTTFESFMDERTKYVTILRNPVDQFVSAFNYFTFKKVVGRDNDSEALEVFMGNPLYYRHKYGKSSALWRYARNNQMFDLGLAHDLHHNVTVVRKKIEELDKEFNIILIGDYLDESLLILRKAFCWSFEDIMYASQNRRKGKRRDVSEDVYLKIRQWNDVDAILYDHFNKSLWRKIAEYGDDFERDLAHLRDLNQQLISNCTDGEITKIHFRGFKQKQFKLVKNATNLCRLVIDTRGTLFREIWDAQDVIMPDNGDSKKTVVN